MRDIKYRAWDKQYKKMCEVSMILFSTKEIDVKGSATEPKSIEHFELMQYTPYIEQWINKSITIYAAKVNFRGELIDALRVKNQK